MENIEMAVNEIRQNLIAAYRSHCKLKMTSRQFKPVMNN